MSGQSALESLRAAGAAHALVSGSGPTVFALFDDREEAAAAADAVAADHPRAVAARPAPPGYGDVTEA